MTKYIPFIKDNEVWVREWAEMPKIGSHVAPNIARKWKEKWEKSQEKRDLKSYPSHPDHVEWFKERLGVQVEVDLVDSPHTEIEWMHFMEGDKVMCLFGNSGHKSWEELRKPNKIKLIFEHDTKPNELIFEGLEFTPFSANDFAPYTTYAIPKEEKDLWEEADKKAKDYADEEGVKRIEKGGGYDYDDWWTWKLTYLKQHYTLTKK